MGVHNPDFNYGEFATIKSQAGLNSYKISVKEWVAKTNAIGLQAKAGRYGGTYAHSDIPFEFGMCISAEFKIYLDKILAKGRFGEIREDVFMPREAHVDESLWLASVEKTHAGAEGDRADDLCIMDSYMAGLVRWLHYIGIETSYSCDGHGERPPQIDVISNVGIALWILKTRSDAFRQHHRDSIIYQHPRRGRDVSPARTTDLSDMLEVGEWLYDERDELKILVGKMKSIGDRGRSGRSMT